MEVTSGLSESRRASPSPANAAKEAASASGSWPPDKSVPPQSSQGRTGLLSAGRLSLIAVLVFTLFVRGAVLWGMRGNLGQDPDAYREIAENLLKHGEFALGNGEPEGEQQPFHPTAFRPPLYPVVLSN